MKSTTEIDGTVIIDEEWIQLEKFMGRAFRTLRKKYRDPNDEKYLHVNTYNYIVVISHVTRDQVGLQG